MLSELIIGSRKSSLAKFQSYLVAYQLKNKFPELQIKFRFIDSQGDRDQTTALWKMEGKSVFTQDLHADLIAGNIHCIVHSWKDLDLEERLETVVQSVLEREDSRDVLLFKKSTIENIINNQSRNFRFINIATSSPRRERNLGIFLPKFLPKSLQNIPIQFNPIRGNIQTRFRKFIEQDFDGYIVAKAALDRMLNPEILWKDHPIRIDIFEEDKKEFIENKIFLQECITRCEFMILPLSQNPSAPAQGALCVEYLKSDTKMKDYLFQLENKSTKLTVIKEREFLSEYGGGCHQKIGVSILEREFGVIKFTRGLTDSGIDLEDSTILPLNILNEKNKSTSGTNYKKKYKSTEVWPPNRKMAERTRNTIQVSIPKEKDLFITRSNALPENFVNDFNSNPNNYTNPLRWTAGLNTWKDLAERNIWVHGSFDSLGENEKMNIENLVNRPLNFIKLTHNTDYQTASESNFPIIATYQVSSPIIPVEFDPTKIKAAFWRSITEYEALTSQFPELMNVDHYSGPGSTYKMLSKKHKNPTVYLSFNQWLEDVIEA
ncbi:MAG: hydroxymethylbilane synthase [Leptospiraceae bacterium]|nr:hydroxymethylbilane synthase [Leptospiraceae bacterium]